MTRTSNIASRVLALCVVAGSAAFTLSASAQASGGSCTFDPPTAVANVVVAPGSGPVPATLAIDGSGSFGIGDPDLTPEVTACGPASGLDTVSLSGTLDSRFDFFVVEVGDGTFGPGATDEPGDSDEIELDAAFLRGQLWIDEIQDGAPVVQPVHNVLGGTEINLNGAETTGIDADLTVTNPDGIIIRTGVRADLIDGSGGLGTPATDFALPIAVQAGRGADVLLGGSSDDSLAGHAGADQVYGRGGADLVFGSGGNDPSLSGGSGNDMVDGSGGDDHLVGGPGNDILTGGEGYDVCRGGPGRDRLVNCEES